MHLHRVTRDVEAYRSSHPVRFPVDHVVVFVASGHETVFVPPMSGSLAPAITRDVAEHFGVLRGEQVRRANHVHRARRCRIEWQGRQVLLRVRTASGCRRRLDGHLRRRRGSAL